MYRIPDATQIEEAVADSQRFLVNGRMLTILLIQLADSGIYICTASNPAGQASTRARVTVVQISSQVQADIRSFSNAIAIGSTVCHNPEQPGFEVRCEIRK